MADQKPPQGWKQGNQSNIYEANISQINIPTGTVSIVAETNKTTGSYTVYTTQGINFIGGRTPIYTVSSSGARTIEPKSQVLYDTLKSQGDISKLDNSIKPRVFEINKTFGTEREKQTVANSKEYKSLANATIITPGTDPQGPEPLNQEQIQGLKNEVGKKIKARGKYDSVVYPIGLNPQYQDCIKFSIVDYKSSGLKGFGESSAGSRRVDVINGIPGFTDKGAREILGTITLPIPGGIQDSNTVNWSGMTMGPLEQAFGSVIASELAQGKGTEQLSDQTQKAMKDKEGLRQGIISKFVQGAVGGSGIMQRLSGDIINPNLELLFNSPDLRTFSFSFKLSPRSKDEAILVKKIIRTFKQAMSVKRRESSFLLQSPHTFAISYIFRNQNHPYLNRFKECALTSCNVNYTPEGNYMSFNHKDEPSMVSYQLDLSFQELEPIYDDDYGTNNKDYENIGF